jgi:TolB protein
LRYVSIAVTLVATLLIPALPADAHPPGDIVFLSDGLYLQHPKAIDPTRLSRRSPYSASEGTHPAWSPNHRFVAFEAGGEFNSNIYLVNRETGRERWLTHNNTMDSNPSWSPDGTRIAFDKGSDYSGDKELWIVQRDGTGRRQLTDNKVDDEDPNWSPDGKWISFERDTGLFIISPSSGEIRRLSRGDLDSDSVWSPTSTELAFTRYTAKGAFIYRTAIERSRPQLLTPHRRDSVYSWQPDWSPDTKRIVYAKYRLYCRSGQSPCVEKLAIWTMRPDGSAKKRLWARKKTACTVSGCASGWLYPAWAPDGRHVAFFGYKGMVKVSRDGSHHMLLDHQLGYGLDW